MLTPPERSRPRMIFLIAPVPVLPIPIVTVYAKKTVISGQYNKTDFCLFLVHGTSFLPSLEHCLRATFYLADSRLLSSRHSCSLDHDRAFHTLSLKLAAKIISILNRSVEIVGICRTAAAAVELWQSSSGIFPLRRHCST